MHVRVIQCVRRHCDAEFLLVGPRVSARAAPAFAHSTHATVCRLRRLVDDELGALMFALVRYSRHGLCLPLHEALRATHRARRCLRIVELVVAVRLLIVSCELGRLAVRSSPASHGCAPLLSRRGLILVTDAVRLRRVLLTFVHTTAVQSACIYCSGRSLLLRRQRMMCKIVLTTHLLLGINH